MHYPQEGGGVPKETPLPMLHNHVVVCGRRHHGLRPVLLIQARAQGHNGVGGGAPSSSGAARGTKGNPQ